MRLVEQRKGQDCLLRGIDTDSFLPQRNISVGAFAIRFLALLLYAVFSVTNHKSVYLH